MTNEETHSKNYLSFIFIPIFFILLFYVVYLAGNVYLSRQTKTKLTQFFSSAVTNLSNSFVTRNAAFFRYLENSVPDYSRPMDTLVKQSIPVSNFVFMDDANVYFAGLSSENGLSALSTEANDGEVFSDTQSSLPGEAYYEEDEAEDENDSTTALTQHAYSGTQKEMISHNQSLINQLKSSLSLDYLIENFYHVNDKTGIDTNIFNVEKLLNTDLSIQKDSNKPQILIYHTHANEWFSDSDKSNKDDLMLGVGRYLAKILTEKYGYNVIHHEGIYDTGVHKYAYMKALSKIKAILKENPSIVAVFDLHRDGVGNDKHTTVEVNHVKMAQIMFFNGVSYNKSGPIDNLYNPNLQSNLAFSLQMKLFAMQKYPNFTKTIFLKNYRYNMHLAKRYSLVEVGDQNNTVEEAKNAMVPLAAIIDAVLSGNSK
ncbi:stage II sporulation protein P [Lachnospiraceae bacterium KM106-2]|nr:stage II sporulation protein P [Lachnospiraceae bacterium KM106-2]